MKKKRSIKNIDDLTPVKEILTHKIKLKVQRIRKQKERNEFCRQKNIFKKEKKKFYRELTNKQMNVEKRPTKDELKSLCESILRIEKNCKEKIE